MEVETMIQEDGETITRSTAKRRHSGKRQNKWKSNLLRLGVGALTIMFFAALASILVYRSVPSIRKSGGIAKKEADIQEIHLKAIFSTNHVLDNGDQPLKIINIDNITDQLNTIFNGKIINVADALFRHHSISKGIVCEDPLSGNILQLNMITFYPADSTEEETMPTAAKIKAKQAVMPFAAPKKLARNIPRSINRQYSALQRVDERTTKSGPHRMLLTVTPSAEYQRECGDFPYKETREYSVNVIRRERPTVPPTPPAICPLSVARINLVIMAGEKGTEIRDDKPTNTNFLNQHHMAVTLFEHTVYLLRIQLDCSSQLRTELTATGCNLAQDVNVWIDLNDDGKFDESESGTPYRWPVTSYMAEGIYDIQIYVPLLDSRNIRNGPHKMRISVVPSNYYRSTCASYEYNEAREYSVTIIPRMKYSSLDATPTSVVPHNAPCSPDVGKLILVVMAGEHRTQIRDDQSTRNALTGKTRSYQHLSVVLYEDTVYLLRIQLECTGEWGREPVDNNCNLPHDVAAWIDLNDDGKFSDIENAAPYRWPLASYIPQGVYDLQIYVPDIDGTRTKSGPHRLRLDVTLNEQYRQKCGKNYYRETREYNVTIVRKNMKQTVDIGGPYLTLSDGVCSKTHGKIVLVIMAGEKGSHIRDDTPLNTQIRDDQNRHHLAVTLYENTIYRQRIQLDCDRRSSRAPFRINCNLAYDVNVYIDLNGDGIFDESESRTPNRWPLRSTMTVGIYDLEIPVPSIDGLTTKGGSHIMRVVVKSSDEVTHCSPGNLVCSVGNSAISSVSLSGEQNTQIRDETKQCSSTNNYNDRSDLTVTLFDNTPYTLHVELSCVQQSGYGNTYSQDPYEFETNCRNARYLGVWIDFNNDGTFDDNTERIVPNSWHRDDPHTTRNDISFTVPQIDGRYNVGGQHRMRVVLVQDERYRQPCQNTGYGEVRDYTVQIIQKPGY
ncbi:unnamed protein product [Rotaria sordida]|uniref:GEVED domain-containing protein n=2 Tax=Rotaria sordida TaxID=392033 RepID=A0A814NRG8_9BILA|nr:unnamed protein product [Rotaria sordida]